MLTGTYRYTHVLTGTHGLTYTHVLTGILTCSRTYRYTFNNLFYLKYCNKSKQIEELRRPYFSHSNYQNKFQKLFNFTAKWLTRSKSMSDHIIGRLRQNGIEHIRHIDILSRKNNKDRIKKRNLDLPNEENKNSDKITSSSIVKKYFTVEQVK